MMLKAISPSWISFKTTKHENENGSRLMRDGGILIPTVF